MPTHVVFLHGALGCSAHWQRFITEAGNNIVMHTPDLPGHGQSTETLENYNTETLAQWVDTYAKNNIEGRYHLVGYSMGGYIALQMVKDGYKNIASVTALATKLNWSPTIAAEECSRLTLESLAPILDKLKQEHGIHYEQLLPVTRQILTAIGENPLHASDFANNTCPVKLLLGERDKMVTQEETIAFAEAAKSFSVEILPAQPHLLERMETSPVMDAWQRFLQNIQ